MTNSIATEPLNSEVSYADLSGFCNRTLQQSYMDVFTRPEKSAYDTSAP